MDSTPLVAKSKDPQEQPAKRMQSLYEVCEEVVDGRCARGKRSDLAGLLVVLVLAKLAGMQSLQGASDWIQDQEVLLREGLQLSWKRMPCANTYSYALARLDSQQVNAALAAWFVRKEARSAGVERNRAGEFPSQASGMSIWPLMAKRGLALVSKRTEEKRHRSRCCMCMSHKPALSCSNARLPRSTMK